MQVVKNRIISRIRKIISVWIFVQIGFVFSANAGDIVFTEFFYNKSAGNLPEYVELFNKTESTIDLNGWKVEIDGYQVSINVSFIIDTLDYAVISSAVGKLQSEFGTTYCSIVNNFDPLGSCDSIVNVTSIVSCLPSISTFQPYKSIVDSVLLNSSTYSGKLPADLL